MPRPVVVGGRKGFCSRAIPGPGPSQNPALCGSPPAKCSSASASYWCVGGTPLGALALVRATCRLRHSRFGQRSCPRPLRSRGQLPCRRSRAGSFRHQKPAVPQAGQLAFAVSTPRYGFAVLYLAAIPPHLCRGEPRQKCSGRPGCSRPRCCRLLAQRVSAPLCSGPHPAPGEPAQTLRRCASIRGAVPVRGEGCAPLGRWCALTLLGRSGPGPGGRLPSHNVGLFRCSREPEVSLPRRSRARRPPARCRRPPPGPRSTRCARSAPLVTGRLVAGARSIPPHRILPATRLPATKANLGTHARAAVLMGTEDPARGTVKGDKYI